MAFDMYALKLKFCPSPPGDDIKLGKGAKGKSKKGRKGK